MNRIHPILAVCVLLITAQALPDDSGGDFPLQQVKDHHFFVGLNLSIPRDNAFYPIERVNNARAQIRVGDEIVVEEIKNLKEFKFTKTTKVSRNFAEISDLKCEPAYSIHANPQIMALRMQNQISSLADNTMDLNDAVIRKLYGGFHNSNPGLGYEAENVAAPGGGYAPVSVAIPAANSEWSTDQYFSIGNLDSNALMDMSTQAMGSNDQLRHMQNSQSSDQSSYDALRIQFSIRSDSYLPHGHLVFIFQLKDASDKDNLKTWIHFLSLRDISPQDQSHDYFITSYPNGMSIESQEVYLFANGSEVATNLSPKHVEMNAKDARMYLNYQYLARNEGKTRPPERLWNWLSPEFRKSLHKDLANETITLRINEEGIVTDLIMNPAVSAALNPANIREISSQLYLPALENGKPVPGELVVSINNVVF